MLTFDYRCWGESDGILVNDEAQPAPDSDGVASIRARVVRHVVDPEWQTRDVLSALAYLRSVPGVDASRVPLWGSSLGGGHVIKVAGLTDVKCVVTQIGSIDVYTNWVSRHPTYRGETQIEQLAVQQARGNVFPWTIEMPYGLNGAPALPKIVFEHKPLHGAASLTAPTMLLAAKEEDLFPNEKNSDAVYNILKERGITCSLAYLPGKHYDAYNPKKGLPVGIAKALEWFQVHLKRGAAGEARL